MPDSPKTQKIRKLNDEFRRLLSDGKVLITQGINSLPSDDQVRIMAKVRVFDDFNEANDPYCEHDFGAFEHKGEQLFWKIDYYDKSLKQVSEDPSNPEKTTRVMTVMLAN